MTVAALAGIVAGLVALGALVAQERRAHAAQERLAAMRRHPAGRDRYRSLTARVTDRAQRYPR